MKSARRAIRKTACALSLVDFSDYQDRFTCCRYNDGGFGGIERLLWVWMACNGRQSLETLHRLNCRHVSSIFESSEGVHGLDKANIVSTGGQGR